MLQKEIIVSYGTIFLSDMERDFEYRVTKSKALVKFN